MDTSHSIEDIPTASDLLAYNYIVLKSCCGDFWPGFRFLAKVINVKYEIESL